MPANENRETQQRKLAALRERQARFAQLRQQREAKRTAPHVHRHRSR